MGTERARQSTNANHKAGQLNTYEPGSILIIISRGLKDIEKKSDGLHVTHTTRNWD